MKQSFKIWICVGEDRDGAPVFVGDTVGFDGNEWGNIDGKDVPLLVEWSTDDGLNPSPGDLRSWCKVLDSPGLELQVVGKRRHE